MITPYNSGVIIANLEPKKIVVTAVLNISKIEISFLIRPCN